MPDFNGLRAGIEDNLKGAVEDGSLVSCRKLEALFIAFEPQLREYIQQNTKKDITRIIEKLRKGEVLGSKELDLVKLWIVGDADYYLKMETEYEDRVSELKRIAGEIAKIREAAPDLEKVCCLRGLLADGRRVLSGLVSFLEKKERVAKFQNASAELDAQEREVLIWTLQEQMSNTNT